jgi:hypothetical protein
MQMRRGAGGHLTICVAATVVLAGCATAPTERRRSDNKQRGLPIPAEFRPHIRRAEGIGGLLYTLDKVAAIGTDVLRERVPDFRSKKLGGYLPAREGDEGGHPKDSFIVAFFTRDDPPRIAYEIRVKPDAAPEFAAFEPPKATTDSFVRFVRARQTAIDALPARNQPINPVLVPGEANDEKGILVYLLAGTEKPDTAVFGQHFRVLIPEAGGAPTYVMPLSKTVFEMPVKAPSGEKVEALMITHVVTDWPMETHVLVSLQFRLPVYVGTRIGIWRVDGDKISLVDDDPLDGSRK